MNRKSAVFTITRDCMADVNEYLSSSYFNIPLKKKPAARFNEVNTLIMLIHESNSAT